MRKIWVDATYFIQWARPPVGIIRVEYELIKWSLANLENVGFFAYDASNRRFSVISSKLIQSRLEQSHIKENIPPNGVKHFSKEVIIAFYRLFLSFINPAYRSSVHIFLKKQLVKIKHKKLKKNDLVHPFNENDAILCAGMTWNYLAIHEDIQLIKNSIKMAYYTFCYDIIPVKFPHFCIMQPGEFSPYFVKLSESTDHVFCISQCTEKDYQEFNRDHNILCPPTSIVQLGSKIDQDQSETSAHLKALVSAQYILFVSTIDKRKNHECIYKSILYLLESGYQNLPKFIFVGMRGGGINDLLKDIELDPRLKGTIQILSEVSDADLSALYKHALFTVYPSFYEGWGLPVAESLNYGKMAIVSSTSSLPEVGGDLVDYVHPYDIIGWAKRIAFYLNNSDELAKRERQIREQYKPNSWADFSAQVFGKIMVDAGYHDYE